MFFLRSCQCISAVVMKTLLIVTYHFPPDTSVGGRRMAKFARYLPEFGWRPIVLSVNPKYYPNTDDTRPPDGLIVELTAMLPSFEAVYRLLRRRFRRPAAISEDTPDGAVSPQIPKPKERSFLSQLALALMYLPDAFLPWLPMAVTRGIKLASDTRIDAMMTSSPPNSVQLIGAALHALTGIPWLADLRDPWLNDAHPDFQRTRIARRINALLERFALAGAERIVSVTDEMDAHYRGILPGGDERFGVVFNGYDRVDFPLEDSAAPSGGPLTITYLGSMYHSRDPRRLLEAAGRLIDSGHAAPGELRFEFIGNCRETPSGPLPELIKANALERSTDLPGWLPHHEAIERIRRADVALLLAARQKLQIPAKVFEYIAAGKPVLALTEPDGATGRLIARARCGYVVEQDDVHGLEDVLRKMLEQKRSGGVEIEPDRAVVESLDIRPQTERLAQILDGMLPFTLPGETYA